MSYPPGVTQWQVDYYAGGYDEPHYKDDEMAGKMRHCWNCGDEMGIIEDRYYEGTDTCGKRECERAAQEQAQADRDEAHERLDRDLGY